MHFLKKGQKIWAWVHPPTPHSGKTRKKTFFFCWCLPLRIHVWSFDINTKLKPEKKLAAKPLEKTKMALKEEGIYVLSDQPGQQCGVPTS